MNTTEKYKGWKHALNPYFFFPAVFLGFAVLATAWTTFGVLLGLLILEHGLVSRWPHHHRKLKSRIGALVWWGGWGGLMVHFHRLPELVFVAAILVWAVGQMKYVGNSQGGEIKSLKRENFDLKEKIKQHGVL